MALGGFKDWYYYSDCSSDSSSDERYINEWENKINLDGGLFYVKHHLRKDDATEESRGSMPNDNLNDKSSAGFLGRFMRRRNSRRSFRRNDSNVLNRKERSTSQENAITDDAKEKELEVDQTFIRIPVDGASANKKSLESLFGLETAFSDTYIIVTGFTPNRVSLYDSRVSLGDRLFSVNGLVVNIRNVDEVLLGLVTSKEIILGFQKVKKDVLENESLLHSKGPCEKDYSTANGFVVYARYEGLSEGGPADQGIIYSFPKKGNFLAQIRGAFFTLFHLLSAVSSSPPISSSIKLDGSVINVIYSNEKSELLLIAFPKSKYFLEESIRIVNSVTRCLEFMFQSLSRCFSNKQNGDFLDSFFYKVLTKTKGDETSDYSSWEFENILPTPSSFCFPKEIYMQVDDALNELESNCIPSQQRQRLFSVIGACYFYKGYMICNHLSNKDLLDVTAIMKENDILKLSKDGIQDLVYWREVYPSSCQRGASLPSSVPYSVPAGRWFLLIVGMDHSFLATLFEAGRYTTKGSMVKEPSPAYVEEAQATLRHIKKIAFTDVINKHLNITHKLPEVFSDQIKSTSTDSSSSLSSYADLQNQNKPYSANEVSRPHHSLTNFKARQNNESVRVLGGYLDVDYVPDEEFMPVLGRRAERELALETNSQSRISVSDSISDDSDWLKDNKSARSYAEDANEFNKNNIPEDYISSPRLFSGEENVLIHFVNFEACEGILISSIENVNNKNDKYVQILQTFRQHAHKIQKIFRHTILFKKVKSQDKPEILNKSLVAVNEYGSLFHFVDDAKKETVTFWVVGKLFFMPHPREVYVCYFDSCPQSMIEIAFQIALYSSR